MFKTSGSAELCEHGLMSIHSQKNNSHDEVEFQDCGLNLRCDNYHKRDYATDVTCATCQPVCYYAVIHFDCDSAFDRVSAATVSHEFSFSQSRPLSSP